MPKSIRLVFNTILIMSQQRLVFCSTIADSIVAELENKPSTSIFILTDSQSKTFCLPLLQQSETLKNAHVIEVPAGDGSKDVNTLVSIWQYLSENGATRKSLMINLGGGMITDLGGFAASTFKRGMNYVNVPTTLLAMVDAAVGGKTGINFNGLKNEVGVINPAKSVLIDTNFLRTLDMQNLLSGYAEMIKHALISSESELKNIFELDFAQLDYEKLNQLVQSSIYIKEAIVTEDPQEEGVRKALNLGHTIGHAFESYSYQMNKPALHGYAVAWGLMCELFLSYKKLGFPKETLIKVARFVKENYGHFYISCDDYDALYELMLHDKKNTIANCINFSLLSNVGVLSLNQHIDKETIFESLDFFQEMMGM